MRRLAFVPCLFVALVLATSSAGAQPAMPVPQPSPAASVSQTIGLTQITITYHRPGVKSRQIWGALVPYGDVWRAGANENTTIAFTDPVKIEGNDLPAGTYGLHMIPTKDSWTIIFSKNATSWGSFFYDQKEDALRVTVKPENAEFQEWLGYTFTDLGPHAVTANLRWEKLRVPFRIDIDVNAVVLNHARSEYLRGPAGFTWQGFSQAAAYCLQNDVDVTDGLAWIDRSIGMNENFNNVAIKSGLLDKTGKTKEAEEARKRALELATTEAQVNQLGYQYMGFGNLKAAVAVFKKNVADHPDSWNVYDSLGEAQANAGDAKLARENYTKALSMVKDEGNKKRITGVLEQLKSK